MAHAYTPGLTVASAMTVRSIRRLPLAGEVVLVVGDRVKAEDIVAKTDLPGNVRILNVANLLSIEVTEINACMLKTEGDSVTQNEVIAETKGLFGIFKSQATCPTNGNIESISQITGQVLIREPSVPVVVRGYVDGTVVEVLPEEGVVVETYGTYIQGIFGVGGEVVGNLEVIVDNPSSLLSPNLIDDSHQGKIIVGGAMVSHEVIQSAIEKGVKGIVCGGISDKDLHDLLGYELGIAITGSEDIGITLVITEGFGQIDMAQRTFDLLLQREDMQTSINGATQIRAGVVRPEIIIPIEETKSEKESEVTANVLEVGTQVRVIREPHFGSLGQVSALPAEPQQLESEAKVRVLEITLESGDQAILPRANVEIIEV